MALLPSAADAERRYVQEGVDPGGQPVLVRQVLCRADGRPDTWADLSLVRQGGQYRVRRLEYNEGARAVLDRGQSFPVTRLLYTRYVLGGQPFDEASANTLLRLWRMRGMRFRMHGAEYRCQVD